MTRNAGDVTSYFCLPPNGVVELLHAVRGKHTNGPRAQKHDGDKQPQAGKLLASFQVIRTRLQLDSPSRKSRYRFLCSHIVQHCFLLVSLHQGFLRIFIVWVGLH